MQCAVLPECSSLLVRAMRLAPLSDDLRSEESEFLPLHPIQKYFLHHWTEWDFASREDSRVGDQNSSLLPSYSCKDLSLRRIGLWEINKKTMDKHCLVRDWLNVNGWESLHYQLPLLGLSGLQNTDETDMQDQPEKNYTAEDRTWTGKELPPRDFKSLVFTNFTTPAYWSGHTNRTSKSVLVKTDNLF